MAPAAGYYVQLAAHEPAAAYWNLALHDLPLRAWLVGLSLGVFAANIPIIDDIRARAFDAAKRWRTTPVRLGVRRSRIEYVALSIFAYVIRFCLWLRLGYDS